MRSPRAKRRNKENHNGSTPMTPSDNNDTKTIIKISGTPSPSRPLPEDTDGAMVILDYNDTESTNLTNDSAAERETLTDFETETETDEADATTSSKSSPEAPAADGITRRMTRSFSVANGTSTNTSRRVKNKSYIISSEDEGSSDDNGTQDDDDDEDMEAETELDEEFQTLIQRLNITDYYDLRENHHLMSRKELRRLYNMYFDAEPTDLAGGSIKFEEHQISKEDFETFMKRRRPLGSTAKSTARSRRSERRKSIPPKYQEAMASCSVPNGHSKPEITTTPYAEQEMKTSYEARLLAKPRVTYKIKTHEHHPKSAKRKEAKLKKKVIISKKKKEVILSKRPLSVRKELKRLFTERGEFPSWIIEPHQEELRKETLAKIKKEFSEWMFLLRNGFNILLYGYGSKVGVFKELEEFLGGEFTIMEIDGTVPKVDATEALSYFVSDCLIIKHSIRGGGINFYSKVKNLLPKLRPLHLHPPVFLFVRNLEQIYVKNEQLFYLISNLAQLPFVHLVASCDHYNSPLIFDQGLITDMSIIWKRCTTCAPYISESKMVTGAFTAAAFEESTSKVTLGHVYGAVTLKSKRAFNILASLQLQAIKSKQYDVSIWSGIEFNELARHCREKFIASNDAQLNTLLLEFIDNKLIVRSRVEAAGGGGRRKVKNVDNCLRITIDESKLEEFLIANPVQQND